MNLNYILFETNRTDADNFLGALNAALGYPKPNFYAHGRLIHGDTSYSAVEETQPGYPAAWRVCIPDANGGTFDPGPPVTISAFPVDPALYNGVPAIMDGSDPAYTLPVPP